jgi:flagellar protein FlbD
MIKLTRLNHSVVGVNPDHIALVEANPDTTLFLYGGDKLLVLESIDDLIERIVDFRRATRTSTDEGDIPRLPLGDVAPRRASVRPPHSHHNGKEG